MAIHTVAASAFHIRYLCYKIRHRWTLVVQNRATWRWNRLSGNSAYPAATVLYRSDNEYRSLHLDQRIKPTKAAMAVNYLATVLGFAHVTFGILIFSSLQLIEVIDVVTVILRYLLSTLVSRLILIHELGEVRRQNEVLSGGREEALNRSVIQSLSSLDVAEADDYADIELTATANPRAKASIPSRSLHVTR